MLLSVGLVNAATADFTFTGLDMMPLDAEGQFTIGVGNVVGVDGDPLIRYKAIATRNGNPLVGQAIYYPDLGDVPSDRDDWSAITTDADGVVYFGPATGFPLSAIGSGLTTPFATTLAEGEYTIAVEIIDLSGAVLVASPIQSVSILSTWTADDSFAPSYAPCTEGVRRCTTIQAAIDAAAAGDTINVAAGTYNENIIVDKDVTLQGAGSSSAFIIGDPAITVQASGVTVDGFDLTNTAPANELRVVSVGSGLSAVTITNNRLHDSWRGIEAYGPANLIIRHNDFDNIVSTVGTYGGVGVFTGGFVDGATISDNTFTDVAWRNIDLAQAGQNIAIERNAFSSGKFGVIVEGYDVSAAGLGLGSLDGTGGVIKIGFKNLQINSNVFSGSLRNCIDLGKASYSTYPVGYDSITISGNTGTTTESALMMSAIQNSVISGNTLASSVAGQNTVEITYGVALTFADNDLAAGTGGVGIVGEGLKDVAWSGGSITTLGGTGFMTKDNLDSAVDTFMGFFSMTFDYNNVDITGVAFSGNAVDVKFDGANEGAAGTSSVTSSALAHVVNTDSEEIDATRNWWGTPSRSLVGAAVSGAVDYEPWYLDAAMTILSSDDTAPPVSAAASSYGFGTWTNADVTVTFSCTDAPAGCSTAYPLHCIDDAGTCTPDTMTSDVTVTGEGQWAVRYMSTDNVGNIETVKSSQVLIDKTAPSISGAPTTAANAEGWYKGDVVVHFTAADDLSGIASVTPDETISAEGAAQSSTGTALDNAGNPASATVSGISIDKTAPTTTDDAPAAWQDADAIVTLSPADALSGVLSTKYCTETEPGETPCVPDIDYTGPVTVGAEGKTYFRYSSADRAGNEQAVVTKEILIDKTAPVVTVPADMVIEATSASGAVVTYTATATDAIAGVLTPACGTASGATFSFGMTTVTCTATDDAGNVGTASFKVTVNDTTVPVITLLGSATVNIYVGSSYADAGATAADNIDGDITADIVVTNPVDTAVIGTYIVKYNVVDAAGNDAVEVTRTVNVLRRPIGRSGGGGTCATGFTMVNGACVKERQTPLPEPAKPVAAPPAVPAPGGNSEGQGANQAVNHEVANNPGNDLAASEQNDLITGQVTGSGGGSQTWIWLGGLAVVIAAALGYVYWRK